jgi:3-oxoacyl-[acyl-carrier protein] reductase
MDLQLTGRTALVFGGSRGLGRAIAAEPAAREVAGDGITANALLPGCTNTDRMAELGVDDATVGPRIPAGRLGDPAEFAALAAFLASGRASYITGQAIAVDGGLLHAI